MVSRARRDRSRAWGAAMLLTVVPLLSPAALGWAATPRVPAVSVSLPVETATAHAASATALSQALSDAEALLEATVEATPGLAPVPKQPAGLGSPVPPPAPLTRHDNDDAALKSPAASAAGSSGPPVPQETGSWPAPSTAPVLTGLPPAQEAPQPPRPLSARGVPRERPRVLSPPDAEHGTEPTWHGLFAVLLVLALVAGSTLLGRFAWHGWNGGGRHRLDRNRKRRGLLALLSGVSGVSGEPADAPRSAGSVGV